MSEYFKWQTSRRIHESKQGFWLKCRKGIKKQSYFFDGRDVNEIGIEPVQGKLGIAPWFVKYIHGKDAQLGNDRIAGTV